MADGQWDDWVGRTQTIEDHLDLRTAKAMSATLGLATCPAGAAGDPIPHPWNWAWFLEPAARKEIGPDGHPKRGGFLPPIPNPRRMWAGSRCTFHAPLPAGHPATKTSTLVAVSEKTGRAGPMVFVTVAHEIHTGDRLSMREEQDIVYMDIPDRFTPPTPQPLPDCTQSEPFAIDPVLLFRFSALTFNAHRIHYDRDYAVAVEHYPGLVVHGPLQAIALHDLGVRLYPDRVPAAFRFRGLHPLFDHDEASLNAREAGQDSVELYAANGEGTVTMKATLEFRP